MEGSLDGEKKEERRRLKKSSSRLKLQKRALANLRETTCGRGWQPEKQKIEKVKNGKHGGRK